MTVVVDVVVSREQIVEEAMSWLGVPYRDLGRTRHGLDCVGLILAVYGSLGLITYEVPTYRRIPDGSFLSHFTKAGFKRIGIADMRSGDAVAFKQLAWACHCGIVTPRGVVHSYSPELMVVEQPLSGRLRDNLIGVYRAPGVE